VRAAAIGIAVLGLLAPLFVARTHAQFQPPSERLHIQTRDAWTWGEGNSNIVQLQGPLTIETDQATLTAQQAVIWLTPVPGSILEQQRAEVALLGDAQVRQGAATRSGERLFVSFVVRGSIRITAEHRLAENRAQTELYRQAVALRARGAERPPAIAPEPGAAPAPAPAPDAPVEQRPWMTPPTMPPPQPATAPTTRPIRPAEPVTFRAADAQTVTHDGRVAIVLSGGITLFQPRANRDFVELQADRAVLFTPLRSLRELGEGREFRTVEDAVTAAYLEGDVRITYTPGQRGLGEQRLQAERVYYEFTTDRAVLTDAVINTVEPQRRIPIIVRADVVRQLALGEYRANDVELSTSAFAVPSYRIAADRAYVRQEDTGDPRLGTRTTFRANNATLESFNVPFFYLPVVGGAITERGAPLRGLAVENNNRFGTAVRTEWGLFETLGQLPPRDLDIAYRLDYLSDRGPAAGVSADYRGGFVSETTRQGWNFEGDFDAYATYDEGHDELGRRRIDVEPEDEFRGRILWQHQHFFPEDWQAQVRAGFTSDPTFLEQFFEQEFDEGLPHDVSLYLKRQRQSEAFTILLTLQPNDVVTTADQLQEQFEVERLPEVGYYRVGESFWNDRATFYSANTASALEFQLTEATLAEQGFRPGFGPGIPSQGYTGADDDTTYRGDFRQEVAFPFSAGRFKVTPYVMGRYTPYGESPDEGSVNRVMAGAGVRVTTAVWKVDDAAQSRLFDVNRLRHVVEPELHVFTSVMNTEREDVFVYDEPVDAVNDVTAVQVALRQRWQTKRGGAGRWRSVDFFTLNVTGDFFFNQPDDALLEPKVFRGLFFPSMPEASIPRNAINADALWRVSDTTAVLADVSHNLDHGATATASVGMAVQRDTRLSYFLGARYIGEINSTIASFNLNYELSTKYALTVAQSVSLSSRENRTSSVGVIRRFDRFFMTASVYYDAVEDVSGVRFGIVPEGLGPGLTSQGFGNIFGGG
jgi:hypothetical protein